ncbi:CoA transferase [Nocardioides sp. TF02-7]|uniref:CaiB/BaiF CoA transferase family protein n=1 Tax=Nocardioides sp. TF02-7 TaxID=2917724 RepID=UPI001F06DCDF|nr:CoA transferase [Nocardioides sp. TF02-7]UMG93696.1 CoA transferase [Nocardioides sp. TF02-7]
MSTNAKPLSDLRIIAVEQYGAGPFGSMHLADLGAEVIKIEDPRAGGDVGRYVPPYGEGEDSLFFETFNRNKRSVSLDLSTPAGRSVFEELVKVSDVVYSNLRGDVPAKIGITYDDLKHLNPQIVCVSLTGFGMTGPRQKEPGYDYVLQGLAGWMDLTGEPDGPPTKSGLSLVDYSGGFVAAISLLAGVHAARRDGKGMDCDVSLYDTAISLLTYPATWHLNAGYEPARTHHSAHPSLVPFQAFQAKDGWMVVGCAKEKFWQRLAVVVGRPEWGAEESPYGNFSKRQQRSAELLGQLEEIFLERTVDEWLEDLYAASIPCGPINDVPAALREEHTHARNLVVTTEHPRFGTVEQLASPVRVGSETPEYRRAPHRNEDMDYVARELLSLDDERLAELRSAGAFGNEHVVAAPSDEGISETEAAAR